MSKISVYQSHIEVSPYQYGDAPQIEKMYSKWDGIYFEYKPIAYYIEGETLYLPRGTNLSLLEKIFNTEPEVYYNPDSFDTIADGEPLYEAKSPMQDDGISFLCGIKNYKYSGKFSQLGLNLSTGDGKTYAAIYSILKLKMKTMIITHQEKIKTQWLKSFKDMTTFPEDRIFNIIGGSEIEYIFKHNEEINDHYDIYLVNHQTLSSYGRMFGWKKVHELFKILKIGIKIIDESHKFFENSLMIDYFSNVKKSIYLTATFGRSDMNENRIYKKAYSSMVRFGEETSDYKEKRKHVICTLIYFKSKPQYGITPNLQSIGGFSSYKYIDYELKSENDALMRTLEKILNLIRNIEGRILIISPKIDSAESIARIVEELTGEEVGTVHSKNGEKKNKENLDKKIISSTSKSIGEGTDIKGLRVLIDLEPLCSQTLVNQVQGRLREYSEDKDTYFFYPADVTLKETYRQVSKVLMPVMNKKCKEIRVVREEDLEKWVQ